MAKMHDLDDAPSKDEQAPEARKRRITDAIARFLEKVAKEGEKPTRKRRGGRSG